MVADVFYSELLETNAFQSYTASFIFAGVAQLVEQRIRNAKVGGSTPLFGTKFILTNFVIKSKTSHT